ncbi:MAG TPA: hypothetical protein VEN31_11130 [Candidatus Bathyarchaeia archaeon]|nr:hypothetical protein [Candidatus Bathyarchaeia archaeon]
MIIVVEGPSGAGKTTWCRMHGGNNALLESLPDHATVPTDPQGAARFWVDRNVARWDEVIEREARDGLVVVDTDPFKLHYVWSLWRTGQATEVEWTLQRDAAREAFAADRYALADIFLIADVDAETLRTRRAGDMTRTRRNFEIHVKLRDATIAWYRAIDGLESGRVIFGLPDSGIPGDLLAKGPRRDRTGVALFDRLMHLLGAA